VHLCLGHCRQALGAGIDFFRFGDTFAANLAVSYGVSWQYNDNDPPTRPMHLPKPISIALLATLAICGDVFAAADAGRKLDLSNDKAYEHVISPIFAATCTKCHGAEKAKGKLRLHTPEEIAESETVVAGKPEESVLLELILLPQDDEDVMPPEGKKQLTEEQKKLIGWWIAEGASFDKKISELNVPEDIAPILANYVHEVPEEIVISKVFSLPEPDAAGFRPSPMRGC